MLQQVGGGQAEEAPADEQAADDDGHGRPSDTEEAEELRPDA